MLDAIILGGGISGLAAARTLENNGKKTLVLEARNRLGGRLYTSLDLNAPIDLGGSWAYELEQNLLVNEFKSQFKLLPFGDLMSRLGKHVLYGQQAKKIELTQLDTITQFVSDFFSTLISHPANKNPNHVLDQFSSALLTRPDIFTVKKWLSNLLTLWTGAELPETSIKIWQSMIEDDGGQAYYVLNGYDEVIRHLASNVKNIRLKQRVKHVDFSNAAIQVYTDNEIFETKTVIVTLPIGVLKSNQCRFTPCLPAEKKEAIQAIGNGLLDKAVLQFPRCFWDEDALSIQCFPTKKSPIQFYVNYQAMIKVPVLVALYGGKTAQEMNNKTNAEQKKWLLEPLQEIYSENFEEPKSILTTSWSQDVFSLGSYSYLPYGQESDCFERLAHPVADRLFFAGEATHPKRYATVHGAYESGIRAANEVLHTLNTNNQL